MTVVRGVAAALCSGWVVRRRTFDALLTRPARDRARATPSVAATAHAATKVAFVTLRVLRLLPGWQNTCLYRAVAECLVLRALGAPATLRLGVARVTGAPREWGGPPVVGSIAAHAWVDCPGYRCHTADGREDATYAVLRRTPDASA